jgi:copper chaperone NosL
VIGSEVTGPMGHELIPLASRADAEEFLRDHQGRRILRFNEVGKEIPAKLDAGRFD